jgi:hypothetical protein
MKAKVLVVAMVLVWMGMLAIPAGNVSAGRPTPQPPPPTVKLPTIPGDYVPYGVSGNWRLVFDDEFDQPVLNLGKWQPNWLAGNDTDITKPVNSYEESCYDPAQVSIVNSNLQFSAVQRPCLANNGRTYQYASGLVNTYGDFRVTYGFIEALIWLDGTEISVVNWPAFWADGTGRWPTTGEIDIMEGLGGQLSWHYHWGKKAQSVGGYPTMTSQAGWHVFAADWGPGALRWYYDGHMVAQATNGIVSNPMFVIANYGLSSAISDPITVPSNMLVEYVRVWQH